MLGTSLAGSLDNIINQVLADCLLINQTVQKYAKNC